MECLHAQLRATCWWRTVCCFIEERDDDGDDDGFCGKAKGGQAKKLWPCVPHELSIELNEQLNSVVHLTCDH
jgi:hypothetical protein